MSSVLYLNGDIYTMDAHLPRAQAMAVDRESGRILAVGNDDEVRRVGGQYTELVDLRGRVVLPGFIDAHIHLLETAYRRQRVDASSCTSEAAAAEQVRMRAAQTPPGEWILGGHWDKNLWSSAAFPTKAALDAAAPEHPVALSSKDGHLLWVNSLALQRANINADTPEPATGAILRDGSGVPTGVLQESAATNLIFAVIGHPDVVLSRIALEQSLFELQRCGITSIHDIEGPFSLRLFADLRKAGKLGVRVQMLLPRQMVSHLSTLATRAGGESDLLRIGGIKIFPDGTLGSQTAAMLESFEGSPGNYGILAIPEQEMLDTVKEASARGLTVAIHAIGDRAARIALNSIELAQQALTAEKLPALQPRYRLEHVQLIEPSDLERMRRLGVIASFQPFHAVVDRDIAERYWGKRHRRAYAYRTMDEMGIPLAMGSDAPVEIFDPLRILYAATVRRDPATQLPPWLPDQALSIPHALWGYTLGAAYAGAEEAHKGSLTVGKLGDAVVLHENIFEQSQEALAQNAVQATILGGQVVYGTI